MEEELKTLEEARQTFANETRQVAETYEVDSARIQDECDDLDEKIDSLAVAISFAEEGDEETDSIVDAPTSSSLTGFLEQAGASSAEKFVNEINRIKYRHEATKEIDKILQNEIGIMKEGTKESFASRTCEIQKLQQERQDQLSRIEKGMKDLHDMLREHMSEEMNSDSSSSTEEDENDRTLSSVVKAASLLSQFWTVVS